MLVNPISVIRLKKGREDAVRKGAPWIYAGDIIASSASLLVPPGSLVSIETHKGQFIGIGYYNPRSQIACRALTLKREPINADFFKRRLEKALALRDSLIGAPYIHSSSNDDVTLAARRGNAALSSASDTDSQANRYYRLAHGEADHLPGLLIDRFGDILVAQVAAAGMEMLQPLWLQALEELLAPRAILLRNDSAARRLEGLEAHISLIQGELPERVEVHENGCVYFADLRQGQKTGWFYDQRDNRKLIADLAAGKTLLDVYAHSGGFGVLAAARGARRVVMADSSTLALDLAREAMRRNRVEERCDILQGDAPAAMEALHRQGARFDIVAADPPAFVKSRKDIAAGLKGYAKVARLAAGLVEPGGLLFIASCSHHAGRSAFHKAALEGIARAGREAEVIKQTGASPDHPRHPLLPQSEYLKAILFRIKT